MISKKGADNMDYNVKERYIDVRGNDKYEVSNFGNVRNKKTGRILSPQLNRKNNGYARVTLNSGRDYVHRIVAGSFFDCDLDNHEINHIDGNRLNNTLANLEVCTKQENIQHAMLNNLRNNAVGIIVKCKHCKHRNEYDVCEGKDDNFYCAYGEH